MFTAIVRSSKVETTEVSTAEKIDKVKDTQVLEYYLALQRKYMIHNS